MMAQIVNETIVEPGLLFKKSNLLQGSHRLPSLRMVHMIGACLGRKNVLPITQGQRRQDRQSINVKGVKVQLGIALDIEPGLLGHQGKIATGTTVSLIVL